MRFYDFCLGVQWWKPRQPLALMVSMQGWDWFAMLPCMAVGNVGGFAMARISKRAWGFGGPDRCWFGLRWKKLTTWGVCLNVNWRKVWRKGLRAQVSLGIGLGPFGLLTFDVGDNVRCVPEWMAKRRPPVKVSEWTELYEILKYKDVEGVLADPHVQESIAALVDYVNPLRYTVDRPKGRKHIYNTRLGYVLYNMTRSLSC